MYSLAYAYTHLLPLQVRSVVKVL